MKNIPYLCIINNLNMGEEEKLNKRHIQVPNNMTIHNELEPRDLLVYAVIKSYMNNLTKEAFPSMQIIAKVSGYSEPTIKKSIDILVKYEYISIRKDGRKNTYKFSSYKNFEPFSYEFLKKEDLSANEKAYLIASQQYMFKDIEGIGKITYSDMEQSNKINISPKTISRLDKSLIEKGYLDVVKTNARDSLTGLKVNEKFFNLTELDQTVVFTLMDHEDRIENTENKIESMQKQIDILLRDAREKDKELNKLKNTSEGLII